MELKKHSQIGAVAAACAVFVVFSLVGIYKGNLLFAAPPYARLFNTSFENYTVVQIDSFNTSMATLSIVDLVFRDPVNSSKITIKRRMLNPDRDVIYVSELQLLVPPNITATNPFDTAQLKADLSKIEVGVRPLLSAPFAIGSLNSDPNVESDVLVIGLGGSQMNNYLHYKFPKMNITVAELEPTMVEIARKYFGLQEDATQRVLVMDGFDYLKQMAKEGRKFDAIYIDACPTRYPYDVEVMCPVPIFLEESTMDLIRSVLKDTGAVVIKMLLFSWEVEEKAGRLADIYRKHFANCTVLDLVTSQNRVLMCTRERIPNERYELNTFTENTKKFYRSVGLVDEECCYQAVSECCAIYQPKTTTMAR